MQATISPATAGIEPPFPLYSCPPALHPFKNSLASLFVPSTTTPLKKKQNCRKHLILPQEPGSPGLALP